MATIKKVLCKNCKKPIYRSAGRFNENLKFGWNFYCSWECQSEIKTTRVNKLCGNPNCHNVVSRSLNQFKKSKSGLIFCSKSCAAIVNNKKCLKGHAKIKPKLITCSQCKRHFKKNIGNKKYCSMECRRQAERHSPEELLNTIKMQAEKLKRIPTKRELSEINSACIKIFSSWNNAISAAGFIPNRSHDNRMYKRNIAKAKDGHLCDSISELLIDNWLYENNIIHERDVQYPETHHKADWKIFNKGKEIFIEYFGLANDSPRYDRAIKQKEMLCEKQGISLIGIYPTDLYPKINLNNNLKNKFKDLDGFKFG